MGYPSADKHKRKAGSASGYRLVKTQEIRVRTVQNGGGMVVIQKFKQQRSKGTKAESSSILPPSEATVLGSPFSYGTIRRVYRVKRRHASAEATSPAPAAPSQAEAEVIEPSRPRRERVPLALAGKWIAWSPDKTTILGYGETFDEVRAAFDGEGVILSRVPDRRFFEPSPDRPEYR